MSLLEPSTDPEVQAAERAAVAMAERPGSWFGDDCADGRMLTQEQTDMLVRAELWREVGYRGDASGELSGILGPAGEQRMLELTMAPDPTHWSAYKVRGTTQRGGIDSDPLVRLLAHRAWGDRDVRWFTDHGVRNGESVASVRFSYGPRDRETHPQRCALVWSRERSIGVALADGRPGETIAVRYAISNQFGPMIVRYRIGDRPRAEPDERELSSFEQDVCERYGFDQLIRRCDEMRMATVFYAERGGYRAMVEVSDQMMAAELATRTRVLDSMFRRLDDELTRMGETRQSTTLRREWLDFRTRSPEEFRGHSADAWFVDDPLANGTERPGYIRSELERGTSPAEIARTMTGAAGGGSPISNAAHAAVLNLINEEVRRRFAIRRMELDTSGLAIVSEQDRRVRDLAVFRGMSVAEVRDLTERPFVDSHGRSYTADRMWSSVPMDAAMIRQDLGITEAGDLTPMFQSSASGTGALPTGLSDTERYRMLAETHVAADFSKSPAEPDAKPGARKPGHKAAPPVPRWAKERRGRAGRPGR